MELVIDFVVRHNHITINQFDQRRSPRGHIMLCAMNPPSKSDAVLRARAPYTIQHTTRLIAQSARSRKTMEWHVKPWEKLARRIVSLKGLKNPVFRFSHTYGKMRQTEANGAN